RRVHHREQFLERLRGLEAVEVRLLLRRRGGQRAGWPLGIYHDLDRLPVRQVERLRGAEDAVLVDGPDDGHGGAPGGVTVPFYHPGYPSTTRSPGSGTAASAKPTPRSVSA